MAQLLGRLPTISLLSLVDILVVAVLIYEFLVLIRGTRAAPMLVGVGVLALVFWAARVGELKTVDWIQRTLLPYAIFALIVVFQSEIRHLLAKLGRTITLSRGAQGFAREAYDDIVLAANLFSQNQTGALIVIEREMACAPISKAAYRWMRGSLTICWPPFFGPAPRCTTAP